MPYFERRPWQETVDQNSVAEAQASEPDMVSIARSILADETVGKQNAVGPFRCKTLLRPGEKGEVTLELSAPGTGGPISIEFTTTDLTSSAGGHIAADALWVYPQKLEISPGSSETLKVGLRVPKENIPGLYGGRIAVDGTDPFGLFVEFEVIPHD